MSGSSLILTIIIAVQFLASVTVKVYIPPESPVKFCVVAPLFHKYVRGVVPLITVMFILPSDAPCEVTLT